MGSHATSFAVTWGKSFAESGPLYGGAKAPPNTIRAGIGLFNVFGEPATVWRSHLPLSAAQGSFALTGEAAALTWSGGGSKTLTAAQGAFALTGSDMAPLVDHILAAAQGSFTETGEAATLTYSGAGGGLGLQTSLSAFWSMENTSWTDDTASGMTLTGNNGPTTTTGLVGNGASLNGSTQTLSHADASPLNITSGSFSIQVWFKGSGSGGIISKDDGGFASREFALGIDFTSQHVFSVAVYDTGGSIHKINDTVVNATDGNWHHVVATYDGTTLKLYVDNGTPTTTSSLGALQGATTSNLFIGKDGDGNDFTGGTIDQVGLWKGRALSAGDVSLLYNSGAGLSYAAMA